MPRTFLAKLGAMAFGITRPSVRSKDDATSLPVVALAGWMPGAARQDVVAYVKGVAEEELTAHDACWWAVHKVGDGWAWELHEGGPGRAFIPSALAAFGRGVESVIVPTVTRDLQLKPKGEGFEDLLLTESDRRDPTEGVGYLGKRCQPLRTRGAGFAALGAVALAAGLVVLAAGVFHRESLHAEATRTHGRAVAARDAGAKPLAAVEMAKLPLSWLASVLAVPEDQFLEALVFKDGKWEVRLAARPKDAPNTDVDAKQLRSSSAEHHPDPKNSAPKK